MPVTDSRLAPVEEILHGVLVSDPYRWLEERSLPETEEWIREQKRLCDDYFARTPGMEYLKSRIAKNLDIDTIDQPNRVGNRLFYRRRRKGQEQPSICVQDSVDGLERVLINPSERGKFTSVAIHRISRDGSRLAYELRQGGADACAIRFIDTITGHILPDMIEVGYSHGLLFASDARGLFYCHESPSPSGEHTIRFHRFGDTAEDPVLFRASRTRRSRLMIIGDENHLGAVYTHETHERSKSLLVDLYLGVHKIEPEWRCVFVNRDVADFPILKNGRIFLYSEQRAPNGQLLELNNDGSERCVIVPEGPARIEQTAFADRKVYVSYCIEGATQVRSWPTEGTLNRLRMGDLVDLPSGGTIRLLLPVGFSRSSLFYSYESFTEPLRVFEYSPLAGMSTPLSAVSMNALNDGCRPQAVLYSSRDGTPIPMTLLSGDRNPRRNETPVILIGYGGFGASLTPSFSILASMMLELGAKFAFPNIRGGSEFGRKWHEAAQRRNRQVAIDDFVSAAEWLCSKGITSPKHLGILGGSNAGLLVGAAMTQHPNMFRVAICIAPLLDMVRYEQFDRAVKFRHEYGSAEDPDDFQALLSYSPYHCVRHGIDYPAALFVCGDQDDRCNPAHVRKMAARLQSQSSQSHPIIVDYSKERGHAPVLPLSVRVEALTRRIAFLCRELNLAVREEVNHAVD